MNFGTTEQQAYGKAYISSNLAGDFGPAEVDQASALHRLSGAMEDASALARRVQALADRLCGPIPQPVNTAPAPPTSPAVFPAIRHSAEQLSDATREAHAAMDRIERQLP